MERLDLHTALWGWWLLVPGFVLALCVFGKLRWRWRLISMAAVFSMILAAITAAMLPVSWNTFHVVMVGWDEPQPSGGDHCRNLYLESERGSVQLSFAVTEFSHRPSAGPAAIYVRRERSQNIGDYLLQEREFSITPSDFIEKTLGFQICWAPNQPGRIRGVTDFSLYSVTVPHWFVLALCAVCPAFWFRCFRRTRRRRYRLAHGLCPTCGYDLRVQKSGQAGDKCPECGTPLPPTPHPANATAANATPPVANATPLSAAATPAKEIPSALANPTPTGPAASPAAQSPPSPP